jgi:hypothetical protein
MAPAIARIASLRLNALRLSLLFTKASKSFMALQIQCLQLAAPSAAVSSLCCIHWRALQSSLRIQGSASKQGAEHRSKQTSVLCFCSQQANPCSGTIHRQKLTGLLIC